MLQPILSHLSRKRIILASGSPRRKEILRNIGLDFEVIPSTFEETLDKSSFDSPQAYVLENARRKTLEVKDRLREQNEMADLLIGADTVVALDGQILEKPKDPEIAFQMLTSLSGRTHFVHTGVVLIASEVNDGKSSVEINTFNEDTEVTFGNLTPEIINSYIETGEPLDKAGGYGIQALGGTLVESIRGDYFNVVGFPLHHFCKELLSIHQNVWS